MIRLFAFTIYSVHLVPCSRADHYYVLLRAKVDAGKAHAARLKSDSGDMKSVVSALQDSVLAAGMGIKMHGDDGELLRGSRVSGGRGLTARAVDTSSKRLLC